PGYGNPAAGWILSDTSSGRGPLPLHARIARRVMRCRLLARALLSASGPMREPPQNLRSPSAEHTALALIVALAVGLRLWRIATGLPDFLEEAIPFRLALGMRDAASGRIDWNPHYFNYPSLSIYLHFVVQQAAYAIGRLWGHYKSYADYLLTFTIDPTPM